MAKKLEPPKPPKRPKSGKGEISIGRLANLDSEGKAPESRYQSASSAYGLFEKCNEDAAIDRERIVSLRGIYDNHPPDSQEALDECGLGDMPNINLGTFRAKIDAYSSAWMDLNTGGDGFYEVRCPDIVPVDYREMVSGKLTNFFNEAIGDWAAPGTHNGAMYIANSSIRDNQMGIFGIGPAAFLHPKDFRFTSIPLHRVIVPRGTHVTLNNCQVLFAKWKQTLPDMFDTIKDREGAIADGWNPAAVLWAIYNHTATHNTKHSTEDFIRWMNEARNNDPDWIKHGSPEVNLVHCYVQEFSQDGSPKKISHMIIPAGGLNEYGYLYYDPEAYDNYSQIIIPFVDRVGPEGDWHGIKGLGDDIFEICDHQNRLYNWTAANAILNGMPTFTSSNAEDKKRLQRITMTRMGVMYPGITPTQFKLNLDINGTIEMLGLSGRALDENTRIYGQAQTPQTSARGGKPSPTEILQSIQSKTQFSSTQIKNYRCSGLDPLGTEMYRRVTADGYHEDDPGGKVAKDFRDKCKAAGIPKEVYQKPKLVRADRGGSSGNAAVDFQRATQVLTFATNGRGKANAQRKVIASLVGQDMTDAYFQMPSNIPTPEDGRIDMENQLAKTGNPPDALPTDDHLKHLGEVNPQAPGHIGDSLRTQQAAQNIQANFDQYMSKIGSDPLAVMRDLDSHIKHSGQHVQFMASSKVTEEASKPYAKILNDLHQFAVQFAGNMQKALLARRSDGGVTDAKTGAILKKTQAEIQATDMKAQADIQRKNASHIVKLKNLQQAHGLRQVHKQQDQNADLALKVEKGMIDNEVTLSKSRGLKALETSDA